MLVAVEQDGVRRVLHSCETPGITVCGAMSDSLALPLREEAARFARCFPWLKVSAPRICVAVERVRKTISPEWENGTALLSSDLERTPEELIQMCRMLRESAGLLRTCLNSFPDVDYDFMADTEHPEWQPGSGVQALELYTRQLRSALVVWDFSLEEVQWEASLCAALAVLEKEPRFMQNRLFWTADGFCCAGYWLRVQIERCHLAGRRMYELGVSAFGRRVIRDPFFFSRY